MDIHSLTQEYDGSSWTTGGAFHTREDLVVEVLLEQKLLVIGLGGYVISSPGNYSSKTLSTKNTMDLL